MTINRKILFGAVLSLLLVFCSCSNSVSKAICQYHEAAPKIQLGVSKAEVLRILEPTQQGLPLRHTRGPEQYMQDGVHVEIYFFRSNSNYDKIVTDDEFTPYIFHDGKLAAIGWTAIGGPKTQAQPIPEQNITIIR